MNHYLKGCTDLDFIIFTAIISCSVFLSPWFALGLPAVVWLSRQQRPTVKSRRQYRPERSAVVLHLIPAKALPQPHPLPRSRTG